VDRVAGDIFDYVLALKTPSLDTKYSILFDWDAVTHHEPIVRVASYMRSQEPSFLDHYYNGWLLYI